MTASEQDEQVLQQADAEVLAEAHQQQAAAQWLNPKDKTSATKAFAKTLKAAEKKLYVYGRGSVGQGYYHCLTREAYTILLARLKKKAAAVQREISTIGTGGMGCLSICTPRFYEGQGKTEDRDRLNGKLSVVANMITYVKARLKTSGPGAELPVQSGQTPFTYTFFELCIGADPPGSKRYV